LAQYLQEALHREQMLENKLATLQRLVANTQEASETGWQALIDEDRLLSRLEVLENQLQTYSKNQTEDTLRTELVALQEDKYNYETTAKESLRKVLQEKLDAVRKLTELERSLSNTEDECSHLKEMCEMSQKELQQLAEKHQEQLKDMAELQEKLKEAEQKHQEELEKVEREKVELEAKLEEMVKQENLLAAKVESLQADNDFTNEQLTNIKVRMEAVKERTGDNVHIPCVESQGVQVDLVNLLDLQLLQSSSKEEEESEIIEEEDAGNQTSVPSDDSSEKIDVKVMITPLNTVAPSEHSPEKLKETQGQIEQYKSQLQESETRLKESKELVEKLQKQLDQAESEVASHVARMSSVEAQLVEARKQADNSNELATQLKDEVRKLETELEDYRQNTDRINILPNTHDVTNSNSISNHLDEVSTTNHLKEEIEQLKELLQEARDAQKKSEAEIERLQRELDEAHKHARKSAEDAKLLQSQLHEAQLQTKNRTDHANTLQDQLNKAETTTKEVKQQILALRELLTEAQQAAKQSKNEAEQLRVRVASLEEELATERIERSTASHSHSTQHEIQRQAARNRAEFASLKEECSNLRKRIQDIETDMKTSRRENLQLQGEYGKLQESYKELEALKDKLENKEVTWKINLTDAQKEADQTKLELTEANNEISRLKDKCSEFREEISQLKQELDGVTDEYQLLAYRSKTLSTCSMIPLLMLLFAILMALYPTLAELTATTQPV
jgi:chromosome segregation ATPase